MKREFESCSTMLTYGTANALPVSFSSGSGDGSLTATSAFTYDTIGNKLTVDGPLSGIADTTRTRYDADREVIGVVDPDPDGAGSLKMRAKRITYNADAQVTKTELGTVLSQSDADWSNFVSSQEIDTAYDANARPVTQALVSGGTTYALTQSNYDSIGRLNCSAVRMNPAIYGSLPSDSCTLGTQGSYGPDQITKTTYDADSRPTKTTLAYGTSDQADERTLAYSDNGKITSLTDGENNKTTYVYDGFDRLSQTQYPSATKGSGTSNSSDYEQLTYDANSNITQRRVRSAATIGFSFDKLNRMTHKGGSSIADRDFTYDNLDRMLAAKFSTGGQGITNVYDALSRVTSSSSDMGGTAHALTYQYDLADNRTQMNWWDGFYVNYDRLVTGELSKVREDGASSGVGVLATYAYDDLRRRTSLTFGNGSVQALSYDPVSRLSQLTNDLNGTTNDLTATFVYSPASQIASTTRTGDAYAYSANANANTGYTSNGLNQQVNIGGSTATWDSNGNLTSEPQSGITYTYNAENELTSETGSPLGSATLGYDPLNRLDTYNPGSVKRFIYDGAEAVAELDSTGAIQNRYVRGDGADELLVDYSGSGTTSRRFTSADERGSIISLTDSSGNILAIDRYDEYGKPQSTNIGRFQYTGQAWLSEANIDHYKARDYLPLLGIFAQTDPTGNKDSPNVYSYTRENPVNAADPTGLAMVSQYCWVDESSDDGPANETCINVTTQDGYVDTGFSYGSSFFPDDLGQTTSLNPFQDDANALENWGSANESNPVSSLVNANFGCAGASAGVGGGFCWTGNDGLLPSYSYLSIGVQYGPDVTQGYSRDPSALLSNWSYTSQIGGGISRSFGGNETVYTYGGAGLYASYGFNNAEVSGEVTGFTRNVVRELYDRSSVYANGFYGMLGRPYDPDRQ